jgi:hypothetical protein
MSTPEDIRSLFVSAELGGTFDSAVEIYGEDATQYVAGLTSTLEKTLKVYLERFSTPNETPIPNYASAQSMTKENPHKLRAFLQALLEVGDPEMLVMVWRVLHGDIVLAVNMNFRDHERFELTVELQTSGADVGIQRYQSQDFNSASLLHHFGRVCVDGHPRFLGFFAHQR